MHFGKRIKKNVGNKQKQVKSEIFFFIIFSVRMIDGECINLLNKII